MAHLPFLVLDYIFTEFAATIMMMAMTPIYDHYYNSMAQVLFRLRSLMIIYLFSYWSPLLRGSSVDSTLFEFIYQDGSAR